MVTFIAAGNPFGHRGLQQLIKGDWPLLSFLDIGLCIFDRPDSAILLGFDPGRLQELKPNAPNSSVCLQRVVSKSPADAGLWPRITKGRFYDTSSFFLSAGPHV